MQPSTDISPETVETKADEPAADSSLRALAQQYTLDESGEQQKAKAAETPAQPAKAKPKNLNELAERLGVEVKDLYDLEIPSSLKGESYTLGKLKDHMADRDDFTVRTLQFEEDKARKESEYLRAQSELQELLTALPRTAIKPEILEAARQKHEATLKTERKRTLEVIPEWKDEAKRTEELQGIVEHLTGHGFPDNYLHTVYDHRTMRYIRENWQREQRLQKALSLIKELRPNALAKSKPAAGSQPTPITKPKTREEQNVRRYLSALNKGRP